MEDTLRPVSVSDFAERARAALPEPVWDYLNGGAGDEITAAREQAFWRNLSLRPRVLRDVGRRELAATVLGRTLSMPLGIAPVAYHRLAHPDGELAAAAAAAAEGVLLVVAMFASTALEEVAEVAGPWWFQLYPLRDKQVMRTLMSRAEDAGAAALVLTVDGPLMGRRRRDLRNAFRLPDGIGPANLTEPGLLHTARTATSAMATASQALVDPSMTWRDLSELCSTTRLPVVVKGITHPDDAILAVESGATAIVVSTHGGRQLDGMSPAAESLPAIAAAVGDRCELLVDGGIRTGGAILRALALGATAVLVGRPLLWALATSGELGVRDLLRIYHDELDVDLALCGYSSIHDLPGELIRHGNPESELAP